MTYTLIRKVLIRPKELKKLKRHALIKSKAGNKKLYDSVEWRPLTRQDLLLEMLRGTITKDEEVWKYVHHHSHSVYERRYLDWNYEFFDDVLHVYPENGSSYEPFGWAVLKKSLDK